MIKDQQGMTLVELLVAFAVSAIILSGIAYLLFTSLKIAGRNNANVDAQSELQTASNLIMDSVMEAEGICMNVPPSGSSTVCILLGEMEMKEAAGGINFRYKGDAVLSDFDSAGKGELYLVEFPNETYPDDGDGYCTLPSVSAATEALAAQQIMNEVIQYLEDIGDARIKWLLAKNVAQWSVTPASSYGREPVNINGATVDKDLFQSPFTVEIALHISIDYGFGIAEASVTDKTAVRNRLDYIYVKDVTALSAEMIQYERKH